MRRPFLLSLLALLMLFSTGSSRSLPPGSGGPDAKKWQQVDQLLKKDQTASAAKLVDELYRAARQRQDTPSTCGPCSISYACWRPKRKMPM
ncbi:hypothetical protein [Hymenobacter cellulosivorans]|uniref:Uncharacterized protein n=1 Tax=Hymenobacter cellulosivorans TaxID=2932249 RepID=A0ABY4FB36_9BACT|nr:hypothetical protein [Hymenobacter cellulosivorans]UOQ53144.1 hypothetical protein MUN80_25845 [Hymenobacter cellulosivorans]